MHASVLTHAIAEGVRLFDVAGLSRNERLLGRAIRQARLGRGEYFLISKLDDVKMAAELSQHPGADVAAHVRGAFDAQLKRLDVEYLDGYMLHHAGVGSTAHQDKAHPQQAAALTEIFRLQSEGLIKTVFHANPEVQYNLTLSGLGGGRGLPPFNSPTFRFAPPSHDMPCSSWVSACCVAH